MAFLLVKILVIAVAAAAAAGNIQLESTQGILIPAPIAQTLLRTSRSAYGGPAAPAPSYSAPAAPSYSAPAAPSYSAPAAPSYSAPAAPAYQPQSIPSPPCPKNYLFSCAPNLAPVPCSAPASSGGYGVGAPTPAHLMGAYSEFVPEHAVPIVQEIY